MYEKIMSAELRFPRHFLPETRSLLGGMLTRRVEDRLGYGGAEEVCTIDTAERNVCALALPGVTEPASTASCSVEPLWPVVSLLLVAAGDFATTALDVARRLMWYMRPPLLSLFFGPTSPTLSRSLPSPVLH